ncbi:lysophospholipid acyltransferase family protein [Corynebacterium sp.]|uniref:lysophospholipid acyltransferase family protein n=1 Tax=Corynebacterium sp. TaxID=1720 RepID=UPI0026DC6EFD|nr:lysophospholipid acyltransferase family protein [Corynebacterium sp.]MDO4609906.1 lysophospholipid acyltransferase family protein [Corynebacterium sp.]
MIDGPDMDFVERVWLPALAPLYDTWFRVEATGLGNIPADGPAILVSNHSGNIPVDALMTQVAVHRGTGRWSRLLAGDVAYAVPGVGALASRLGAVRADRANAHRLLADGELLGDYPEGYRGLGKPYTSRYRLRRFGRGGFAALALRHGAPIVPVAVVGAEEIYPQLGSVFRGSNLLGGEGVEAGIGRAEGVAPLDEAVEELVIGLADLLADGAATPLAQLPGFFLGEDGAKRRAAVVAMLRDIALAAAKGMGVPYVPVTPFFPWLGPLGAIPLPSKWTIDVMEPIDPLEWARGYRAGIMEPGSPEPEAHADAVAVLGLAEEVRGRVQERLLERLRTRRSAFY